MTKYVVKPHLPVGRVGLAAAGERYRPLLAGAFERLGIEPLWLPDAIGADKRLAGHADLSMIHPGGNRIISSCGEKTDTELTRRGFEVVSVPGPGRSYPEDCALNACIAGGRLFHRTDITERAVLAGTRGTEPVNIAQGYAKCCTCVVDENSVITSDRGIAAAARAHGLDVLEIAPGYIELEGFDYGFIGGASFKLSKTELAFTGRLDFHPDWRKITCFLERKRIRICILTDYPAFDVGSVLPLTEAGTEAKAFP